MLPRLSVASLVVTGKLQSQEALWTILIAMTTNALTKAFISISAGVSAALSCASSPAFFSPWRQLGSQRPSCPIRSCSAAALPRRKAAFEEAGYGVRWAAAPRVLLLALLPAVISLLAGANVLAEPAARNLDTHQRDIIKRFVLREAKASIVSPRQGEPHDFAAALASACARRARGLPTINELRRTRHDRPDGGVRSRRPADSRSFWRSSGRGSIPRTRTSPAHRLLP